MYSFLLLFQPFRVSLPWASAVHTWRISEKTLWIHISVNKPDFEYLRHQNNDQENVSIHSSLFFRLHTYFITKPSYCYSGVSCWKKSQIRGRHRVCRRGIAPLLHGNGTLRQQWEEELPSQQALIMWLSAERMQMERSSLQKLALTGMNHTLSRPTIVYGSIKLTTVQHSQKKNPKQS